MTLALAVLVAPGVAHGYSKGPSESWFQKLYAACIRAQVMPVFDTVYPAEEMSYLKLTTYSSYSKPLVGRDMLTVELAYGKSGRCSGSKSRLESYYAFRTGRLVLEAGYHYCSGDYVKRRKLVATKPMLVPFFEYETETVATESYDELGRLTRSEYERVKPATMRLMEYPGPTVIPFVNDDTGQPFKDRDTGGVLAFDTSVFKACLRQGLSAWLPRKEKSLAPVGSSPRGLPAESDAMTSDKPGVSPAGGAVSDKKAGQQPL